jgi:putative DNA primase/helicase
VSTSSTSKTSEPRSARGQMPKQRGRNNGGNGGLSVTEIRELAEAKCAEERVQFEGKKRPDAEFTPDELYKAAISEQDGDAWLFTQTFKDRLVFDHAASRYYLFDGYWREARIEEPIAFVDRVIKTYEAEASRWNWEALKAAKDNNKKEESTAEGNAKLFRGKISKLQRMQWKKAVLERAAAGSGSLGISGDEWDREPWWLACTNGVIELKPFKFRDSRPADYVKTVCPTEFKGLDEPAPIWEKFLLEVFGGDEELIGFIQRLLGCALVGEVLEHVFPIFWGRGRNGKGTIFETIKHVMGALVDPIQVETIIDPGRSGFSGGPRSDIMSLRGKRITWASETREGQRLDIKKLSGGDTLTAREPYGRREITFKPTHTLFLITNHKPKADPTEYSLWERVYLVPFEYSFVDNPRELMERKKNIFLGEQLKREASGILAWMVRGCIEWQRVGGLFPPGSVKAATEQYRQSEDLIGQFINECCTVHGQAEAQAGVLRKAYEGWCEENGYRPVTGHKFSAYLQASYDRDDLGRHRRYIGIGLKPERVTI